jgi:DNA-binding NtrC family response regulator
MLNDFGLSQSGLSEEAMIVGTRDSTHLPTKSAGRVLVVDDEPLIRWSLVETLEERGYEVVEADDGRGALLAVGDGSLAFAAVLLDFRLPDSSDLTLLARLRALAPATPIILMTAFGTPEMTERALELGAFRVISKPFAVSEMAALVQHAQRSSPS